ncbi:MAG: segregation and condensation protein A [Lachnospiraceae bacterium]
MAIPVKLQVFEGPLDLLLHLIDKNKVNIYDIPIVLITEQYLEYVNAMDRKDLNVISEFLLMAATLLDIKARMLLPAVVNEDGEEEDPRAELVQKLLEYKMYKYMAYELKDRQIDAMRSLYKKSTVPDEIKAYQEPVDLEKLVSDVTLIRLNEIFNEVMKRQDEKEDKVRKNFFGKIEEEEVNLSEKIEYVKEYAINNRSFSFRQLLLENSGSKMQIVVTFLAVLELMKGSILHVDQDHTFGEIMITSLI